jgi:hypothetical protein
MRTKLKTTGRIFAVSSITTAIVMMLSGCATTGGDTQPPASMNAVQSNSGTTVSGYIDVGAGKSFH